MAESATFNWRLKAHFRDVQVPVVEISRGSSSGARGAEAVSRTLGRKSQETVTGDWWHCFNVTSIGWEKEGNIERGGWGRKKEIKKGRQRETERSTKIERKGNAERDFDVLRYRLRVR